MTNKKILMVDDSMDEMLKDLLVGLESNHIEYVYAASGEEALRILNTQDQMFDLIVANYQMPGGMYGPEFLHEVRKKWTVPCLLQSASPLPPVTLRRVPEGIPFQVRWNTPELLDKIKSMLGQ